MDTLQEQLFFRLRLLYAKFYVFYCTGMFYTFKKDKKSKERMSSCTEAASQTSHLLCLSQSAGCVVFLSVHLNYENCARIRTTILEHQV